MTQRRRRLAAILAGIAIALLATLGVLAATADPADKVLAGQEVIVPEGTTVSHDLYAFGSIVTIAGTVEGDLVVAAARVDITGTVTGDVLVAASDVTVSGTVRGDLRAAAARVIVLGQVSEDVASASGGLELGPAGRIDGDLMFTASEVNLEGTIAGGVLGTATVYERRGTIGGPEQVTLSTRLDQPATDRTTALALDALRQYIVVVLIGLALLRFAPRFTKGATDRVRSLPLPSAGLGVIAILGYVAALIGLVVVMTLVAVTFGPLDFGDIVAIDIAGALLAGFGLTLSLIVFSAFIADALVGLAVGRLLAVSETSRWADVLRLAFGAALVVIVTSFPDVGGIVKLLVILVALGAASTAFWDSRRRGAVAEPPPPAVT